MTTTDQPSPALDAGQGSARALTQTGAFSVILNALLALGVVHLSVQQVTALMPVGTAVVCFVMRLAENWSGHGFLRAVPPVAAARPRTPRTRRKKKAKP